MVRITSKGQITIPKALRERAGLMPGADVEVVLAEGVVLIRRETAAKLDAIDEQIAAFAGSGDRRHSTRELMALLRSDD